MPSIENCTAVNREEVPLFENDAASRDAMDDDFVGGCTNGTGKAVVALEGGDGTGVTNHAFGECIEL